MSAVWYFAYGSNMQSATFRGRRRIEWTRALAARAPGWRLVFDKPPLVEIGQSFANIVADPAAAVLGVAYEVTADDLAHIELTEGVKVGNYSRAEITVHSLAAPTIELRAATLVSNRRDPALLPSKRYMRCVIEGAEEHGLPPEYVEFLRALPACDETTAALEMRPMLDQALAQLAETRRRQ